LAKHLRAVVERLPLEPRFGKTLPE
jgi:hypothetical protein